MRRNAIPKQNRDVRRYAFANIVKFPLFYLAYIAFFAYAFFFYLERRPVSLGSFPWWVYLIFALVVLVSGWIVCRMGKWLFDVDLCGRIESYKFVRNYGRGLSRGAKTVTDFHTYIKITVITDKGKKKRVTFPLFEDGYDGYYKNGSLLIKYKGLNYPICPDSEVEGAHICAVCGVRTFYKEGKAVHGEAQPEMRDGLIICRSCGHTLIGE